MMRWVAAAVVGVALVVTIAPKARGEVTAEQVREAIRRAVAYLKNEQSKVNGAWRERTGYPGGVTALCTLALLEAGVPPDDPTIQKSLEYLRGLGRPTMVYSTSLQTMVFCAAEPEKDILLIKRNAQWLIGVQNTGEVNKGAWAYSDRSGNGDKSNSQFALLALYEAERAGVEVSERTWRLAQQYWQREQRPDGSWGYFATQASTGSMTAAGVASLVISSGQLGGGDAQVVDDAVHCCQPQEDVPQIESGLNWLGTHFTVESNPGSASVGGGVARGWLFYYLYGLERVGRMTGNRFIGKADWYRQGAEFLVNTQGELGQWTGVNEVENEPHIATPLALLFLSKGRRPVLMGHLKHGEGMDWNRHRGGVRNLAFFVEERWNQKLTWQTIDVKAASAEELLQTPVLFLSGRDDLSFTDEQVENLRTYLDQGGFLFAEAACGGDAFNKKFRALAVRLYPNSQLRLLAPDHPVWYADGHVDPDRLRPLFGVDACCRTNIVYCPQDLSCYWELAEPRRMKIYPEAVQAEIEACRQIGANVLAYATNRELRDKLDTPQLTYSDAGAQPPDRATLSVAKLSHAGGADDAPNALGNLLRIVHDELSMQVNQERRLLAATDPRLFDQPILFTHGRRSFDFTPAERQAIRTHLERGGFLFGDAICAAKPFADAFRQEMERIFPEAKLRPIPADHPLYSSAFHGFDIAKVQLRDPNLRTGDDPLTARVTDTQPYLEGLEIDGRLAVIFSPYDLSCGLENAASLECKGYLRDDAAKLGINILLYALQQ
jgi:hypothetical protein